MKLAQAKTDAKKAGWLQWIRSEADERAVMDGHWFDAAAGTAVVSFFEKVLRHTMGASAGQPFKLLDWQKNDFLMPLFGWKRAGWAAEVRERRCFRREEARKEHDWSGNCQLFPTRWRPSC